MDMNGLSEETVKFLNEGRNTTIGQVIEKQSNVTDTSVIKSARPISKTIQEMQEELQIRKLQIEIEKLEKPSTNIDYFQKMLELQQQHFNQMLQMNSQQNEIKLELERLKIMKSDDGDFFGDIVKGLIPLIPELLKNKQQQKPSSPVPPTPKKEDEKIIDAQIQEEIIEDDEEMETPTQEQLEQYQKDIKDGKISFEQFCQDVRKHPLGKFATESQLKEKYNEIKG